MGMLGALTLNTNQLSLSALLGIKERYSSMYADANRILSTNQNYD